MKRFLCGITTVLLASSLMVNSVLANEYIENDNYIIDFNDTTSYIEAERSGDWSFLDENSDIDGFIIGYENSEDAIAPASIIGTDGRVRVTNTYPLPYRTMARIIVDYNNPPIDPTTGREGHGAGSGVMISADTVLTAAHVLNNSLYGGIKEIHVYLGYASSSTYYGYSVVGKRIIHPNYSLPQDDNDIALLRLNRPVGHNTGTLSLSTNINQGAGITVTGYPVDRNALMYTSSGNIRYAYPTMLIFDADGTDGQSGSPVYNSSNQIVGVFTGGFNEGGNPINGGVRINSEKRTWINNYINQMISVYCVYNGNSGEHYYTTGAAEALYLENLGWTCEKLAWSAPVSGTAVYQLYNGNTGEHHYTTNAGERNALVNLGWTYEKIAFYSDNNHSYPVYRLYNPNAAAFNHHYTTSLAEKNMLVSLGWNYEGVAFYCLG